MLLSVAAGAKIFKSNNLCFAPHFAPEKDEYIY